MRTYNKGAVTGDKFIGREEYLKCLNAEVKKEKKKRKNIAIHGLPHVGKSSLARQFKSQIETSDYCVVFHDFQAVSSYEYVLEAIFRDVHRVMLNDGTEKREDFNQKMTEFLTMESFERAKCLKELLEGKGKRIVFLFDEFDAIKGKWSEEEYTDFVKVFLLSDLDLFCVTFSRQRIDILLSEYTYKLIPFEDKLLQPFNDNDMMLFFKTYVPGISPEANQDVIRQIVYYCGRNPYLLSLFADLLPDGFVVTDKNVKSLILSTENIRKFTQHYDDVIKLIQSENDAQNVKFVHLVKIFFSTPLDYKDIRERYIETGYIEKNETESLYTYPDDRFMITESGIKYCFTTISVGFIDYLLLNKIKDVRDLGDLLSGLTLTLREIIKERFSSYAKDSIKDSISELLSRFVTGSPGNYRCFNNDRVATVGEQGENQIKICDFSFNFISGKIGTFKEVGEILSCLNIEETWKLILIEYGMYSQFLGKFGGCVGSLLRWAAALKEFRNKMQHYQQGITLDERQLFQSQVNFILESILHYAFYQSKADENKKVQNSISGQIKKVYPGLRT